MLIGKAIWFRQAIGLTPKEGSRRFINTNDFQ